MSESNINTNQQPENNATPAANEGKATERMFTQEEVNRIVTERLAREKAKGEPSPLDEREQALKARESRLSCREYVNTEGLPTALLDVLDTSDLDGFKAKVQQLDTLLGLPSNGRKIPRFTGPAEGHGAPADPIADAFKPRI